MSFTAFIDDAATMLQTTATQLYEMKSNSEDDESNRVLPSPKSNSFVDVATAKGGRQASMSPRSAAMTSGNFVGVLIASELYTNSRSSSRQVARFRASLKVRESAIAESTAFSTALWDKSILHSWNDEDYVKVLNCQKAVLEKTCKLILFEQLLH